MLTFFVPALAEVRVVVTLECGIASVFIAIRHNDSQIQALILFLLLY